jgi:hypothetical protein
VELTINRIKRRGSRKSRAILELPAGPSRPPSYVMKLQGREATLYMVWLEVLTQYFNNSKSRDAN